MPHAETARAPLRFILVLALGAAAVFAARTYLDPGADPFETPAEAAVSAAVRESIFLESPKLYDTIDLHTENGRVVLHGVVETLLQSYRAQILAGGVRGVAAVENRIRIRGARREDRELSKAVARRLAADDRIGPGVRVAVREGRVRLSGTVGSDLERQFAVLAAAGVRGVRAVDTSTLEVDYTGRPEKG